ncbi:SRPBCC family protein [Isoptericola sp. b441]|uniref:SRPBCC family protein n=1 Tax=Actinotalea lenta TaxID=3064654 RepID=A0ABT9D764_9CELL|nr:MULTISPECIES: SRPBCC family protein [unclassified Isoptericola]MDO8106681.1 SRPBCC family protein [Isoptericola sp. b441]MDO8121611.1 SRPBCC family protein [Isoptericola sp. b490]
MSTRHRRAPQRSTVLPVPAEQAFDLLTDVRRHADWVPLTRIDLLGPADERGHLVRGGTFVAVTGLGARRTGSPAPRRREHLRLVDRMRLEHLDPPRTADRHPGKARYLKLGPVLTGWAEVVVHPLATDVCEVEWTERIGVRGLPDAVTGPLGWLPTTAMLRTVLARASRTATEGS